MAYPYPAFIPLFDWAKWNDGSYFVLVKDLLQFFGHGLDGNFAPAHASGFPDNDVAFLLPGGIDTWMIDAAVRPAAFCTGQGTIRDGFGDSEHGLQVKRRSEEHTSELQSQSNLVCRLLLE